MSARYLTAYWLLFALGVAGTAVPHLLAHNFLDDARIVRWIAVPVLLASAIWLSDYYFRWTIGII